jgi:uncharacterized integral membrane protein (TIGR00698 family)
LYALLLGLALHIPLNQSVWASRSKAGIDFAGRSVLRIGVALLGFRITANQIATLGWQTALIGLVAVGTTILVGLALARYFRRPATEGLISGGSVAICGASAALTVAAVLPASKENERYTLMVVIGVTVLSTIAMVLYPLFAHSLGLSPVEAGVFFGASIHDVAQVVAAGAIYVTGTDSTALDTATIVKLFRVVLLMPVALVIASLWSFYQKEAHPNESSFSEEKGKQNVPMVPGFLLAFILLMIVNSLGFLPKEWSQTAGQASGWCLLVAIAAAGLKTRFMDIIKMGWVPVTMLLMETVWIALLVLALLTILK